MRLHLPNVEFVKTDPLLDPLRNEPRFQAIERALKVPRLTERSTHASHGSRPGLDRKRSQIARRTVMRAARRIAFSSTVPASYTMRPASLLRVECDCADMSHRHSAIRTPARSATVLAFKSKGPLGYVRSG